MRRTLLLRQIALLLLLVVPFTANAQDMYRDLAGLLEKVSALTDEELAGKPALKMAGELTVSFAYTEGDDSFCYVQDNSAGVRVGSTIPDFMSGSILVGATLEVQQDRSLLLTKVDYAVHDPAEPEAMSAEGVGELFTMPENFLCRLIQLDGVTLQPTDGATEFAAGAQVPFTDAEGETGLLQVFAGSELVGEPIPTEALTLTGVFVEINSEDLPVIAPRSSADLGGGAQEEMMSVAEMLEAVAMLDPEEIALGVTYTLAEPVVTFFYEGEVPYCYMEDPTAAVRVESMEYYEIGDMLSGATIEVMDFEGETVFVLMEVAEVMPTDGVEPMVFTLAELVEEDPMMMENRLVKIANAMIEPEDENVVEFSADVPVEFIDENGVQTGVVTTALIRVFAGTDVEGTEIPFDPIPLTGLVSYDIDRDMYVISPRSLDDMREEVVDVEPGIRITTANESYAGYACVGEKLGTYHVALEAGVEEDITIAFDNEDITCDHETVSAAEAARGVNVYFDITVRKEGNDSTIVVYSSGEYVVKDTIRWEGKPADYEGTIAGARTYFDEAGGTFTKKIRLTGEMTVNYVEAWDKGGYNYYVQDETGGIILRQTESTPAYQVGDVVTGVLGQMMAFEQGMYSLRMITMPAAAEHGREAAVMDVTAEAMQAVDGVTPVEYQSRMVRLSGVTFVPKEGVTAFAKDQVFSLAQGRDTVTVMLKGDDLEGEPIPTGVVNVVGLSVRGDRPAIYLLSKDDITEGTNGICSPLQINASVWTQGLDVFVEAEGLIGVEAYTLAGVKVASVAGGNRVALPEAGAYLVKIQTAAGAAVQKVLVK